MALIRATTFIGFQELVWDLGGDPESLLRQCQVDPVALQDEDGVVSYRAFVRVLELSARQLKCPDFGLRLAKHQGFLNLGPIALTVLNSPTVAEAYQAMSQALNVHSSAIKGWLEPGNEQQLPRIVFDIVLPGDFPRQQADELAVGNLAHQLRIMTQSRCGPHAILLPHQPLSPIEHYLEYFQCEVLFGQPVTAVEINHETLNYSLGNVDPQLQQLVNEYVLQAAINHPLSLGDQVRFLIKKLLPTGCGIKEIARNLCVHERTLQRKLTALGLIFKEMVDEVRRDQAAILLARHDLSMAQISALLGYNEQASFNRACSRWFARTPSQMRSASLRDLG